MTEVMYLVKGSRFSGLVNMRYGGSLGDRVVGGAVTANCAFTSELVPFGTVIVSVSVPMPVMPVAPPGLIVEVNTNPAGAVSVTV